MSFSSSKKLLKSIIKAVHMSKTWIKIPLKSSCCVLLNSDWDVFKMCCMHQVWSQLITFGFTDVKPHIKHVTFELKATMVKDLLKYKLQFLSGTKWSYENSRKMSQVWKALRNNRIYFDTKRHMKECAKDVVFFSKIWPHTQHYCCHYNNYLAPLYRIMSASHTSHNMGLTTITSNLQIKTLYLMVNCSLNYAPIQSHHHRHSKAGHLNQWLFTSLSTVITELLFTLL